MFESSKVQQSPHPLLLSAADISRDRWQDAPLWLAQLRAQGSRLFEEKGFPHRKQEEWKYTPVGPISKGSFAPPAPLLDLPPELNSNVMDLSSIRLVFINGFFAPRLSRLGTLADGLEVCSLADAINRDNPLLKTHLGAYANAGENSFVALNNAFIEDGVFIHIKKGTQCAEPIHLVYISESSGTTPPASFPRNLLVAEAESSVFVIEDYVAGTTANLASLTNPVTEIVVKHSARVHHYKIQQESDAAFHIATIQVHQEENSHFESHSISFGGKLTRNNIHSYLNGPQSHATFNGLYMVKDTQHVDNHTLIYHHSPRCTSSELYHGILDNKAKGVFNGKIYVAADAQETDSQQTSRSLMLSDDARMDAKPQLEIYADDVKCTHGATVGRLDEDALYYLRSRGISASEARKMLTLAFAQRVIDCIKWEPLRKKLAAQIVRRLEDVAG